MSLGNSNTETRILQMQLDNKDFEDGVRQTIKSLENLEEKLNLKNAGDGFEKVSAAANSVQMSHLESGIDAVTSKFTLMGQIGMQVLERISSRIVDTGEKILRAATIQPMIDGWGEFEMKTNSVQTILGGIRNQFEDQPTAINAISQALDELNKYADKTIYSFAQMTENVGKFTNQGLGLEESTNAIKGIANWAAAVGANPQQMSRAMYNISQSLGAGHMQRIDWRSIMFANMATPEVKKLFATVAKRQGLLSEDGSVKIGKQIFSVEDNFEDTLKAGWMTNEVMAEAFQIYANAFSQEELIARYGEEVGRQFYEMGVYAEEAATKVRTFSQLIGVLKESLGSGWANTFDILFGGFEQQTAFLTEIKKRIEEIINFQTDDRNAWLQNFSNIGGIKVFQDVILQTLDILSDFYWVFNDVAALVLNPFGQGVFNMSDGIFGPRQEGYIELRNTWEGVKAIFDDISSTLDKFRTWMYAKNGKTGRSPIHNLASALSGVAGAAGIAWQVLTNFGKLVFRIFKRFEPLVSSVLDLLGQIGGAIYNVFFNLTGQQSIEKIFDRIGDAIEPVIDFVVGLTTAVVDLIHNLLGIDAAANDWTVLAKQMTAFWDIFKYDPNLDFAENLKNSLKNALIAVFGEDTAKSLIKAWDTNIAPVLEQISGFFERAFSDLNRVLGGLRNAASADYSKSDGLGGGIKTFLQSFFEGYYGEDTSGAETAYTNVLDVYRQIKEYYDANVAPYIDALTSIFTTTLPDLNRKIMDFLFGTEKTANLNGPGQAQKFRTGGLIDNLLAIFSTDNLTEVLSAIQTFFDPVIQGISDAWNSFYDFLFGPEKTANLNGPGQAQKFRTGGLFSSITDFFGGETWAQDWTIIKGAFEEVSSWVTSTGNAAWNTIMDFLFGPEKTANLNGPGQAQKFRTGGAYQAALDFLTPVWDWLQSTGSKLYDYIINHNFQEMWKGLNDLLFGYDAIYNATGPGQATTVHTDGILTPVVEMLRPIADVFNQVKSWALEKLSSIDWSGIWESIGKFFTGYDEIIYDSVNPTMAVGVTHHESVFEKIAGFFERIVDYFQSPEFQEFIGNIKTFYHTYIEPAFKWIGGLGGELFGAISDLLGGKGLGGFSKVGDYLTNGLSSLLPEGLDLGGLLGGLLGGETGDSSGTTGKSGGFNLLDMLLGSANADEFDASATALADEANGIVAVFDSTAKTTEKAATEGSSATNSILGSVSKLLPYFGGAAAIGLVGKVGDMITGITGNRKPTIIEQISMLIGSLGEVFKGLGIAMAAAGFAESISPNSIDKMFGHITSLLDKLFGWVAKIGAGGMLLDFGANLGGQALSKRMFGAADGAKVSESTDFSKASEIISSIGAGIGGLFDGLQTMYNLVWEVMAADAIMGIDENGVNNFDKKLDRVLGFVGKILLTLTGSEALTTVIESAKKLGVAALAKQFGLDVQTDSMFKILTGLGAFVEAASNGIAAIMTASIVPGILNLDMDKFASFVSTVLLTLSALLTSESILSAINGLESKGGGKAMALAKIGEIADVAILDAFFLSLGAIAGHLVDWYLLMAEQHLTTMAPAIYTFISNLTGALEMLAKIGTTNLSTAETVLSTDLPRLLGYIDPEKLGYDKEKLNDVGTTIRDFGNRVYSGISTLGRAKDVFDKYSANGGERQFPLDFFQEMTEALSYLQGDGIKELYNSVFGQGGFFVGNSGDEKANIDGLNSFFSTLGGLGWALTSYNEFDGLNSKSGTKIESTKEGLDAFQDAFSGIQASFHSLMGDIGSEKFSIEKINALADFLTRFTTAANDFAKTFYYKTNLGEGYDVTSPITQFGGLLQTVGSGIRQLNDSLKTGDTYDINYAQIESALNALKPMAEIEKTIYEYSKLTNGEASGSKDWNFMKNTQEWIDTVLPRMQNIGTQLHLMAAEISPEDVAALTSSSGALTSLASFMSQDFYANIQVMGVEEINGYAGAFSNLKKSLVMENGDGTSLASTIQQVFDQIGDKEVKLKITPVIDDTNFKTNLNLPENVQLNNEYSRNITLQVNMNDIQKVQVVESQISTLVAANNSTRDRIDSLAAAIRNIKINVSVPTPGFGSRGPGRNVEVYPLVANYQP